MNETNLVKVLSDYKGYKIVGKETGGLAYAFGYPTFNCQIFSIGGFGNILRSSENPKKEIKAMWTHIGKVHQVLIDVNRQYEADVEKLFPTSEVVFKQPYRSTNNTEMTMYLLNTQTLHTW